MKKNIIFISALIFTAGLLAQDTGLVKYVPGDVDGFGYVNINELATNPKLKDFIETNQDTLFDQLKVSLKLNGIDIYNASSSGIFYFNSKTKKGGAVLKTSINENTFNTMLVNNKNKEGRQINKTSANGKTVYSVENGGRKSSFVYLKPDIIGVSELSEDVSALASITEKDSAASNVKLMDYTAKANKSSMMWFVFDAKDSFSGMRQKNTEWNKGMQQLFPIDNIQGGFMNLNLTGQNKDNLNIDTHIICKEKNKAQLLTVWLQPMVISYISLISQGNNQLNDALLDAIEFSNEGNHILVKANIGQTLQNELLILQQIFLESKINNTKKMNEFGRLLFDVLPIDQRAQEIKAISSLPVIGEFETNEEFKKRQEQARYQKSLGFKNVIPKLVACNYEEIVKHIGAIILFRQTPKLKLPRFNRELMCFENVQLQGFSEEACYNGKSNILGQFYSPPIVFRFKINDLSVAKKFKEEAEAGRIRIDLQVEPWLIRIENPIITEPARQEREVDKGQVSQSLSEILFVAAVGLLGDDNAMAEVSGQVRDNIANRDYEKTIKYPAKTREGVRFHFVLDIVRVAITDYTGKQIPGVDFEWFTEYPKKTSIRIAGLSKGIWEGAKLLKEGDEILTVAGKNVKNSDEYISIIKAQPPSSTYKITYRSVADGREHEFVANSDKPLGIDLIDVYPSDVLKEKKQ